MRRPLKSPNPSRNPRGTERGAQGRGRSRNRSPSRSPSPNRRKRPSRSPSPNPRRSRRKRPKASPQTDSEPSGDGCAVRDPAGAKAGQREQHRPRLGEGQRCRRTHPQAGRARRCRRQEGACTGRGSCRGEGTRRAKGGAEPASALAHLRGTKQKANRIRQITAKKTRESLQADSAVDADPRGRHDQDRGAAAHAPRPASPRPRAST